MGKRELGTIPGPLLPAAPWKLPPSGLGAGEGEARALPEADWPTALGAAKVEG